MLNDDYFKDKEAEESLNISTMIKLLRSQIGNPSNRRTYKRIR